MRKRQHVNKPGHRSHRASRGAEENTQTAHNSAFEEIPGIKEDQQDPPWQAFLSAARHYRAGLREQARIR
jgi:hypothetical protein